MTFSTCLIGNWYLSSPISSEPVSGKSVREIARKKVVLPDPLGPMIEIISPEFEDKVFKKHKKAILDLNKI